MHGRWWINDPDCILVRDSGTSFTSDEIVGIASVIAMSGAMCLLSDDLKLVSESRLALAKSLNPATGKSAVALDLMEQRIPEELILDLDRSFWRDGPLDAWHVVCLANWGDKRRRRRFDLQEHLASNPRPVYHCFEFWTRAYVRVSEREPCILKTPVIGAHSACIFAVRAESASGGRALYLGSDIHFTCGAEVASWEQKGPNSLQIELFAGRLVEQGRIWLYLPGSHSESTLVTGGSALIPSKTGSNTHAVKADHYDDVWILPVRLEQDAPTLLEVSWSTN